MTDARRVLVSFWFIGGALTAARIATLILSDAGLGQDEAQYWFWSRDPAFGYFSKPPMIAWAIAATTAVFGNAEWAVRLAAPLFHFGTAAFLYLGAALAFDRRVALWTGLGWLTLPGVILSGFVIATDAPLLFFWSGALYFLLRITLRDRPSTVDFAALGAMIGFGLLSKYAMVYFPTAMAGALLLEPSLRAKLLRAPLLLTAAIALALAALNAVWNMQHDFSTLSHTAANANWGVDLFRLQSLLTFLGSQFAVAGIVPLLTLIVIAASAVANRGRIPGGDGAFGQDAALRMLLIFTLLPLLIICAQSFISRAHANWAATAYPSGIMLVTAFLFGAGRAWLAQASVVFHGALLLVFSIAMAHTPLIDGAGFARAVKEIRGWEEQTAAIADMAEGYDAVAVDDRALMGAMLYYQRDRTIEVVALDPNASVDHHYEAFEAFDPERHKRVLFASIRNDDAHVDYRFRNIVPLGGQSVSIGPGLTRTYTLFDISGYYGK